MTQPRNGWYYQFGYFDYDRHHLAGAHFTHRGLESVDFSRASAPGIDFRESYLHEIDFSEADLTGACFARAKLHDVHFNKAILRDATFADAELSDVDFSGAMLQGTDLAQATLVRDVHMDNPRQWSKLTLSADGTLLAWFEERKQQIWLWKLFTTEQGQVLATTSARLDALFFHPLTHLLVSVHADHSVIFWDADARQRLHHLQLTSPPRWNLARDVPFSPDGRWLAIPTISFDGRWSPPPGMLNWNKQKARLILWDVARMCIKQEMCIEQVMPAHWSDPFAFSPQSTLLAIGRKEAIEIWDLGSGALHQQLPLTGVRELTFQASGNALFALADRLYLVEVATGALLDPRLDEHPGHTGPVTRAVFCPDGHLLATCDDQTVQVWEVPSGKHLFACAGQLALFSPDGSWLAVRTGRCLQHWDCATWSLIHTFEMSFYPDALLFSPDGQLLLGFSGRHSVTFYTVWTATSPGEDDLTDTDDWYDGHFALYQSTSGTPFWPDLAEQTRERGSIPAIWRASFSPDSRSLTVFSEHEDQGRRRWRWDLTTGALEYVTSGSAHVWDRQSPDYNLPFEDNRQSLDYRPPVSSPDGRWQAQVAGHHVQIWDQEHQRLVSETNEPPNPQTIYPAWHDRRIALGLVSAQETWRDLLGCIPSPDDADQELMLIGHKLAFEYCQELPPYTLPRGSRQDASWNRIQERTPQANTPIIAAVHKDGTLSVFHTGNGRYQQMYDDPLRPEQEPD